MHSKKPRLLWCAILLVCLSIVCSSVIAKSKGFGLVAKVDSVNNNLFLESIIAYPKNGTPNAPKTNATAGHLTPVYSELDYSSSLFMTIIIGANEEVECTNDGSTLAKFFLCGTSDVRNVSLSLSGTSYEWQKLDPNTCATTVLDDCPTSNIACTWNNVGTASTYNLDSDGEFRVRVDSGQYYYFKSSLNPLNPQVIKEDVVCGNPGRVEVTNVPSGYEYSLNNSSGPYQDTPYFDVTSAGNYMIWVRLKNVSATACLFPSNTVTIVEQNMSVDVTAYDILCSGELGSIDVEVFDVPGYYTYRLIKNGVTVDTFGPNAADTYSFDNVSPGTYSIRIETNHCSELISTDINSNPIIIGNGISPIAVTATANNSFGCGAVSVDVTLGTTGGTAPYRYSLDGGTTFSSNYTTNAVFTVASAGTYSILVEDTNGCSKTAAVDVENIPAPTYSIATDDGSCGSSGGTVTINISNTNGYNILYSLDGGANFQVSNVFSGLAPNTYNAVIRYEQGAFSCDIPDTATINSISSITGTGNIDSSPSCIDENGGQISVTGASGGAGGFTYSIGAGFSGTAVFSNLGVGTYTPRIMDANGCVVSLTPITFAPLDKPTDLDFVVSNIDCLSGTVTVTLSVTNGTAPYTYEIIAPSGSAVNNGASAVFNGIALGTYTFRTTDNVGCSYDESFAITDISSIEVQAQATRGVTCVGDSDGEGRYLVDGFNTTFSYSIDGGAVTTGQSSGMLPLTGLAAGNYVITVTDEQTNCTDTATLTISEPSTALAIDNKIIAPMTCQNANIGGITIETIGGWGGNRYTLTLPDSSTIGPNSSNTFSGLSQSGLYQVAVNDVNGCIVTDTFSLTALTAPILSINTGGTDYCYDNIDAAAISVSATSGVGPYQYRINNGPWDTVTLFSGLTPGNYAIEVMDTNNCTDIVNVTIAQEVTAFATTIQELDCGSPGPDAQIRVNISNGYTSAGDYDYYEVSVDGSPYTSSTTNITGNFFVYTIPNDGSISTDTTFQFEVYDIRGCLTETNIVTISPPETIAGTATGQDTVCGDPTSGIVVLTADTTQGIPPYEYSNDNGATYSTQNVFSGYAPGTYTNEFRVRDSRGCESPLLSATIGTSLAVDATVVPANATCTGTSTVGSIDVTNVANGTANYTYTLLDINGVIVGIPIGPTPNTTETFLNVVPGTYTVVTTDATGCEDRDVVVIDQNELNLVPVNVVPPPDCTTAFFTYEVNIVGGTGPYMIGLVGNPLVSPNVDADTHDFSGEISYGVTYFVEVQDFLGCTYIEQIDPIVSPSPIAITATATTASCDLSGNGEISYIISAITPSPADFTILIQNTDTGGIVGGPFSFTNESMPYSNSLTGLQAGNYQILVNDDNTSCDASVLVTITQDIPSVVIDNNTPATCNVGALVTVRANGGTAPYEFAYVSDGALAPASGAYSSDTTYEIGGPYAADYDFYVRDASGCISFTTVTVDMGPEMIDPTVDVTNQCNAVSDYIVEVTAPLTTGSGLPEDTFQYDIGGGFQDSPNFTVPNPGTYTITVRDGNGCTKTVVAEVFDFFSISASATSKPTCNAGDGVITVNTFGGSGNFEYQLRVWDNSLPTPGYIDVGAPQLNNNVFSSIGIGEYNIVVTDLNSNTSPLCSDNTNVEVKTVVSPVISTHTKSDVTCHNASDGSIIVELQAGTDVDGPFTYSLYLIDKTVTPNTESLIQGPLDIPLFVGLTDGNYQVEVVSERNCTHRSNDIIIINPPDFMLNADYNAFTCNPSSNKFNTSLITAYTDSNGDGTGTATGTSPYTYSMDDGTVDFDGTNFQSSNIFELVDNGTDRNITILAKDSKSCIVAHSFTINAPTGLTFTYNINSITCDATGIGVNPGSIDIVMDQGPGNYEVEILPFGTATPVSSGGTDTVTWSISTPGDYIFAVSDIDNGGCNYITSVVNVPEYNNIQGVIAEVSPVTCFGGNDGEISIELNNYTGAYNYEVFSKDNAGIETTTGVTGSFDTTASINSPEIIGGLPAGNMIVRIEALDSPFCDASSNVITVRSPDRALDVLLQQTSEVTCAVPGLGEITATGDGGWGTYEYQVLNASGTIVQDFPNTNNIFTNLSNGIHTINIKDAYGCIFTRTIDLLLPTPIYADIQIVAPLQCNNDNDGIIEAHNIVGGQGSGNYLYQINRLSNATSSGLQTTPIFPNLSAGNYTITVFDGWSCSYETIPITIADPEVVVAELLELQAPGCGNMGLMQLTVTNPEPTLSYFYRRSGTTDSFEPFSVTDAFATSVDIQEDINIDPGPFQYDVQNSNGCPFEKSNQISLDPAAPLVVALDLTNATINCAGEATGIIRSEAFGGIGNYVYTLLNSNSPATPISSNTERTAQSSGIFRNLLAGTYYVYAQSGGCTTISDPIVILPKLPLVLDFSEVFPVTCFGLSNGEISLEASGGSGNIRYSISDNLSEFFEGDDPAHPNRKTFRNLEPRSYEIIIQDDLGCTITRTFEIPEPMELVGSIASTMPEICMGDGDGSVTLNVMGGTAPYFTSVNSNEDADFEQNDALYIGNLLGGETYVIFIRDSRGCETTVIVPIEIGVELIAEPIVAYGCDGIFPNSTATVYIEDEDIRLHVLYALDVEDVLQASEQHVYGDLEPGEHTVYIYHENGCNTFVEFSIDAYEPLTIEAEKTGPNELTATASGGFGGYQYFFQGESFGEINAFNINEDAIVDITVIDEKGCVARLLMPFNFDGMLELPTFFSPNGDLLNDEWGPMNRNFFANVDVKIYDRYGRIVANLDQVKKWDGTYNGSNLPTGDYWYVVHANDKDNQQYVGHFTLYR